MKAKTMLVLSGGADSATLAFHLAAADHELRALSFDYGQRHSCELEAAERIASVLHIPHEVIDLTQLRVMLKGSALTDGDVPVPHGHYNEESMRQTVVPNRNTIMLSIAWGIACAERMDHVAIGVHAGDHHIYPDCRPEYVRAIEAALVMGTVGHREPHMVLIAPFLTSTKEDIIRRGLQLGVPYDLTWTCYEGGERPCGECGSCRERAEAFDRCGAVDPLLARSA